MLVEQLPQDSAVDRAHTDGQTWTWNEQLLWLLVRRIEENTVVIGKSLGNKKLKLPKEHPRFPWSVLDEAEPARIGDRGEHDSIDVMNFLDSL